ncbi:MAG: hypothetical protein IKL34_05430 [Alistipes sp.]|nr:hypothetical protein [Alistipes sp.]
MGCVIADIECRRLDTPIEVNGVARLDAPATAAYCGRLDTPIEVTCSIICDVGIGEFVRFALSSLQWLDEENRVGVTKYNTIMASGDWSLEDIEIEELL